jgi:hypothetical protein
MNCFLRYGCAASHLPMHEFDGLVNQSPEVKHMKDKTFWQMKHFK